MKFRLTDRRWLLTLGILAIFLVGYTIWKIVIPEEDTRASEVVSRGTVSEIVSVSGIVEAQQEAELTFPTTGIVTDVFVEKGSIVQQGDVLATLASAELAAERRALVAERTRAEAKLSEVQNGAGSDTRALVEATVSNAARDLEREETLQNQLVAEARRALLTNDLAAVSTDPQERALAPAVSGTYACDAEGTYTVEVYRSASLSGYSYRVSGLEQGGGTAYTDQPGILGTCGLRLQFDGGANYSNSTWTISIPNKSSATYTTYKNAYDGALVTRAKTLSAVADTYALSQKDAAATINTRGEVIVQERASVSAADAKIAALDASIADRSIIAPFSGVVTEVGIAKGESAQATKIVRLIATDSFEVTAKIPEVDISKLAVDQHARMEFDAKPDTTVTGTVTYVAPQATLIDGVAYFPITVRLNETLDWMRAGLNVDVDIVTTERTDALRLPKRFVVIEGPNAWVIKRGTNASTSVSIGAIGNDGYVEIHGLNEGDVVVAP